MATISLAKTTQPNYDVFPQEFFLKSIDEEKDLCEPERLWWLDFELKHAAMELVEDYSWLTLGQADYEWVFNTLCGRRIPLRRPPVTEVLTFEYRDSDDVWNDVDATIYEFETNTNSVRLKAGESWPSGCEYRITYRAGSDCWMDWPKRVIRAIGLLVRHWDRFREDVVTDGALNSIPKGFDELINSVKDRTKYEPDGYTVDVIRRYAVPYFI